MTTGFAVETKAEEIIRQHMGPMSMALTEFWTLNFWMALVNAEIEQTESRAPGAGVVLAYFGGSDWCTHCIDLNNEVFKSTTFRNWFKQRHMVPFHADYPEYHSQDPILKQQNLELDAKYKINMTVPQVLALHADGSEIGRLLGYASGYGPDQWIQDFSNMSGVE
jgi:thioredoxin-related protein